mgnify:CR=1 FL=1
MEIHVKQTNINYHEFPMNYHKLIKSCFRRTAVKIDKGQAELAKV